MVQALMMLLAEETYLLVTSTISETFLRMAKFMEKRQMRWHPIIHKVVSLPKIDLICIFPSPDIIILTSDKSLYIDQELLQIYWWDEDQENLRMISKH